MYFRAPRVLVLEDDPLRLHRLVEMLRQREYSVVGVSTAAEARLRLDHWPADLMIVPMRVGTASGLQMILACRTKHPELAGMIITEQDPHVLDMDAWRHGIAVISSAADAESFLMVVAEQIAGIKRRQRWPRKRVMDQIPVNVAGSSGRVVDVSYGGLRMELPSADSTLPARVTIDLPELRLRIRAQLVWSARGEDGTSYVCGVAVAEDAGTTLRWRQFVDRVG
ncbi:MAG TPA: response regulator [Vicinamibacterales bacterium]|nr:response regulator [Vicinamibacterales bacterium]